MLPLVFIFLQRAEPPGGAKAAGRDELRNRGTGGVAEGLKDLSRF